MSESMGARVRKPGMGPRLRAWGLHHAQSFFASLGDLTRRPVSTLMTAAVIGIALALPAGLHLLLSNAQTVTAGWDGTTEISVYLKTNVSGTRALALADEWRRHKGVADVRYVSRDEALAEFRRLSGFGQALDTLGDNPLPAVLVVRPVLNQADRSSVATLVQHLSARPEVDLAQVDLEWVQRLYAFMDLVRRGVWVLGAMLALAVLLVVGNTIRLAIQNRRDEIVVGKLIGATDAFIRRPFLYGGAWYGLMGALLALLLIALALALLNGPTRELSALYHSTFALRGLGMTEVLAVLASGTLLGLGGSWLAVGRYLREIEPT